MEYASEIRSELEKGGFDEVFEYLVRVWPSERGERLKARIGDEGQEMDYVMKKGVRDVPVKMVGWKRVLEATAIGEYVDGERVVKVVMVDGGRGHTGKMRDVRFAVGLFIGGEMKGKVVYVEDTMRKWKEMHKKRSVVEESAVDKLLEICENLRVEEKVVENVIVSAVHGKVEGKVDAAM